MIMISKAIKSLYPTSEFIIENEDISKIRWIKNQPTGFNFENGDNKEIKLQELKTEAERLKEIELAAAYMHRRRIEYPPLTDLADALYHQSKGDNSKMEAYISACQAVKDKYPKE